MEIKYPDYQNGIVNLACSVLKHYGIEYKHNTLPAIDQLLEKNTKNIVVVLLDGMGVDALEYHLPEDSFLRRHYINELSSVFPPTTTAATTSMNSGLTPVEHGWLGWSLYFRELDHIVNIFPNTVKFTEQQAAAYHVADTKLPYKNVCEKINETGNVKAYSVSKFGTNKIASLDEMIHEISRLCGQENRKYIYAYWEDPDNLMHDRGCYDGAITACLKEIDLKLERMSRVLTDTLLIITADHGHINLTNKMLSDYPEITKMMKRPTSIETRAACFYIKQKYRNAFREVFYNRFGEDFLLLDSQEIIERKLFGDGVIHPRFKDFIGDFIAIAISDKGIVNHPNSIQHASNHAGLTRQEMMVPLIIIET